jgi:hypothetical protein
MYLVECFVIFSGFESWYEMALFHLYRRINFDSPRRDCELVVLKIKNKERERLVTSYDISYVY